MSEERKQAPTDADWEFLSPRERENLLHRDRTQSAGYQVDYNKFVRREMGRLVADSEKNCSGIRARKQEPKLYVISEALAGEPFEIEVDGRQYMAFHERPYHISDWIYADPS